MRTQKSTKRERQRDVSNSFVCFLKERIEVLKTQNRYGTSKNYSRTLESFKDFLIHANLSENSAINSSLIERYSDYLEERGIKRNSISFYMRNLRAVYNKGVRLGYFQPQNPFRAVYTGIDKTPKRAVSEEIILNLMQLDLSQNVRLDFTRDLFLFSLFTRGMSFVDIAYLKWQDIEGDKIYYNRRKTGQTMTVKIEVCTQKILQRYKVKTEGGNYVFPILKGATAEEEYQSYLSQIRLYNARLKDLSDKIGLSKSLTSYTSRHTWATIAHKNNVPIRIISAGMGHTSEKTTLIYLMSMTDNDLDDANHNLLKRFS